MPVIWSTSGRLLVISGGLELGKELGGDDSGLESGKILAC